MGTRGEGRRWCQFLFLAGALSGATASRIVDAAEPRREGIELGLRLGYGMQGGRATGTTDPTAYYVLEVAPIVVDAGYRLASGRLFVGLLFVYGVALEYYPFPARDCDSPGVSCSGYSTRLAVQAQFHMAPEVWYDPWIGTGFGIEFAGIDLQHGNADLTSVDLTASGFEFLNLQVGLDFHVTPHISAGPFFWFSMDSYRSVHVACRGNICDDLRSSFPDDNPTTHEWAVFGIRGTYLTHGP